jgi:hypothetical protein
MDTTRRQESDLERLDRNTTELVNELRVAGTGVQVMFAFLLVIPFDSRFSKLTPFERDDYFATLICVAVASMLLIAPSVHHRLLFRRGEKEFLVRTGSQMAIAAAGFLSLGFTGIFIMISDLLFGPTAGGVAGACIAALVVVLWFVLPLLRRIRGPND